MKSEAGPHFNVLYSWCLSVHSAYIMPYLTCIALYLMCNESSYRYLLIFGFFNNLTNRHILIGCDSVGLKPIQVN